MTSYAVIFRTHVWDKGVADIALRARNCCGNGTFVVAADETNGTLACDGFTKLSHTGDFSEFGLPTVPPGRVLWWNADYVLYVARRALPGYDYYVMLEYDVFLNCNVDNLIAKCAENNIGFVAHDLMRMGPDEHWSYDAASEMGVELWWALIPFVIVSDRVVDMMRQTRDVLAAGLLSGQISQWPYCESFMPTAASLLGSACLCSLAQLGIDTRLLDYRPFRSARDPALQMPESIAHPVMSGARYINSFLSLLPPGAHQLMDRTLRAELQYEDAEELEAVFGGDVQLFRKPDGKWSTIDHAASQQAEIFRPWADLAKDKPATQSSHSVWSRGATAAEDAMLAIRDPLPEDYAFHTDGEENPWWQVDLLDVSAVERIEIVNRVAHSYKFNHFRIDMSQDGMDWTTCVTKLDNAVVSSDPDCPARITLDGQAHARFVRIILLGTNCLHLRRIRVLGFALPLAVEGGAVHQPA